MVGANGVAVRGEVVAALGKVGKSRKRVVGKVRAVASAVGRRGGLSVRAAAMCGIGLTGLMSAALNGYCYSQHAPAAWAGWALGFAVPVLVLILGRVAGGSFGLGRRLTAWVATVAGLSLLALSVHHCAASIAAVTGSSQWLAVPLALAVDVGLVACELALMGEDE